MYYNLLIREKTKELKIMSDIPCGTCDVCEIEKAKYWYGRTNAATCGASDCKKEMDKRYAETCRRVDEEEAFKIEMENY